MKTLIFDIQMGVSGDMLLSALLELGLDLDAIRAELQRLNLETWDITAQRIIRHGISGTMTVVKTSDHHHSRNLDDITRIIDQSGFSEKARSDILAVFRRLGDAEARVHGTSLDAIHFHEVGAADSILDISGFCIGVEKLGIERIYFGDFCFGTGTIQSSHGELPVPAPAVVELTRGYRCRSTNKAGELITPTAAALLTTLGMQTDPGMSYTNIAGGVSFGTRDYPFPSCTRVMLVQENAPGEEMMKLECNIDDMNPQIYPPVIEGLLEQGAVDAYLSPLFMKKGRPGIALTVIAEKNRLDALKEFLYRETSTLGIRAYSVIREKLDRTFVTVTVRDQSIRIKVGMYNNQIVNIQPEYDDCRRAARETGIPLKMIIDIAREEFSKQQGKMP